MRVLRLLVFLLSYAAITVLATAVSIEPISPMPGQVFRWACDHPDFRLPLTVGVNGEPPSDALLCAALDSQARWCIDGAHAQRVLTRALLLQKESCVQANRFGGSLLAVEGNHSLTVRHAALCLHVVFAAADTNCSLPCARPDKCCTP